MKIVIDPDSYKECLSSREVAAAMADAVLQACPSAEVVQIPLADGGEGTLDVLAGALGAKIHKARVSDPLGRTIDARFATLGDTGIIEVSQACGLHLLASAERNPIVASSKGVGELIMEAFQKGCRRLVIGLGGSATCDGGAGMLSVPGVKDALRETTVELLCDVDNPFIGPEGAARVFAPQKGASPADVEVLEARMAGLARVMAAETGVDVSSVPGAGAAGVLQHCLGKRVALLSGAVETNAVGALYDAGFWTVRAVTPRGMHPDIAMDPEVARQNIFSAVIRTLS